MRGMKNWPQSARGTGAIKKADGLDCGSPSRSVSGANSASLCEETASPFGRAAARRAAIHTAGNVLFVTVFMVALIGLALLTFLSMTSQENKFTMRSQSWGSALVTAEAGLEEALTHVN